MIFNMKMVCLLTTATAVSASVLELPVFIEDSYVDNVSIKPENISHKI